MTTASAEASRGWPWSALGRLGADRAADHPLPDPPRRVLLVSPALPLTDEVIARTIEIATPAHAVVTVLGIARVFGTSLGLPHPGLQPNRLEWEDQRNWVNGAAKAIRRHGFETRVGMARSRNAPKMIARWGMARRIHAIVVPDPERAGWRRALEGDIKREVERRCGIPVIAVPVPPAGELLRRARPA